MPPGVGTDWLPMARIVTLSFALNSTTSCLIASTELRKLSTTSLIVPCSLLTKASSASMLLSLRGELDELVMPPLACSRALSHWTRGCMALSSCLNLFSSLAKSNPSLALVRSLNLSFKESSSPRYLLIASILWVLLIILASFQALPTRGNHITSQYSSKHISKQRDITWQVSTPLQENKVFTYSYRCR